MRLLAVFAAVAATTLGLVLPFAYAISDLRFDLEVAGGVALALGLLFGWRGPQGPSPALGAAAAFVGGLAAALVAGLIPGNGVLLMVPPLQALTSGFLCVARNAKVARTSDVLRILFVPALWLGCGLLPAMGLFGVTSTLVAALAFSPLLEAHRLFAARHSEMRQRRWPLPLLLLGSVLVMWHVSDFARRERPEVDAWVLTLTNVFFLYAVPSLGYPVAVATTRWFQLRVTYLRALGEYLRALYVPIGAFTIGYLVIIAAYAGFYGTTQRIDAAAFRVAEPAVIIGIGDWLFFSFAVATGQSVTDIAPHSGVSKVLVGSQLVLCLAWAIVVFAAVMAHVQPVLQQVAERRHSQQNTPR